MLRHAEAIQLNLSAPRVWRDPVLHGDEETLAASPIPIWVHAPYLVNPASTNPEMRAKSRHCLEAQSAAAARIGALGVVVHGGHATGGGSITDGIDGWLRLLDGAELPCRVLIENTAGGSNAPARHLDALERLLASLRDEGHDVGFVLDTCHAHASGVGTEKLVEQVRAVVGSIDLVHLNDSKDPAGSGRDRHERLGKGHVDPDHLVAVVEEAGAPVVVEGPGGVEGQAADIAWIRARLGLG